MTSWASEAIVSDSEKNSLHISADFSMPFDAKRAENKSGITKTVEKKIAEVFPIQKQKNVNMKHKTLEFFFFRKIGNIM